MLKSAMYSIVVFHEGKYQWMGHASTLEDGQAQARKLKGVEGVKKVGIGHLTEHGLFQFDWTEE